MWGYVLIITEAVKSSLTLFRQKLQLPLLALVWENSSLNKQCRAVSASHPKRANRQSRLVVHWANIVQY